MSQTEELVEEPKASSQDGVGGGGGNRTVGRSFKKPWGSPSGCSPQQRHLLFCMRSLRGIRAGMRPGAS